jgi:hypothetical protein
MKPRLRIEVVPFPTPTAQADLDAALDVLADALADRFIRMAREQIAAEIGVEAESIDREARRDATDVSDALRLAGFGGVR